MLSFLPGIRLILTWVVVLVEVMIAMSIGRRDPLLSAWQTSVDLGYCTSSCGEIGADIVQGSLNDSLNEQSCYYRNRRNNRLVCPLRGANDRSISTGLHQLLLREAPTQNVPFAIANPMPYQPYIASSSCAAP